MTQAVPLRAVHVALAFAVLCAGALAVRAQVQYRSGQSIAPSYEGYLPNADGSFDMLFGYMNRNFEEHIYVPIGPDNAFEPGPIDQGQPTYFLPRRNMNQFRITVPKDFGKKDLIWTLTSNGKTERAYASLKPEYILDARGIYRQYTGFDVQGEVERNKPPVVRVQGDLKRTGNRRGAAPPDGHRERRWHSEAGTGAWRSVSGSRARAARRLARVPRPGTDGRVRPGAVQGVSGFLQRIALDAGVAAAEAASRRLSPGTRPVQRARNIRYPCARTRRRLRGVPGRHRNRQPGGRKSRHSLTPTRSRRSCGTYSSPPVPSVQEST